MESGISNFLSAYSKMHADAKEKGNVDLTSSDAITFRAYRMLTKMAIENGDTFCCSWIANQWNLICRR